MVEVTQDIIRRKASTLRAALAAKEAELAAERAKVEKLREALANLVEEYTMNVDSFRTGGFYTDPETEEVIIAARATLAETQP